MRSPGYRILLLGQAISILGTWVQGPAQRWLVLELTGSPLSVGILGASASLPILLFSLVGGWISDRSPRIRILMAAHGIILLQALFFGLLVQFGRINLVEIYVLAFFFGYAMAFEVPARQALIYDFVGRDGITNAVAIHSMVFNASQFAGPAIAGFLMTGGFTPVCFYIKAASAAAILLALVRLGRLAAAGGASGGQGVPTVHHWMENGRFLPSLLSTCAFVRGEPFVLSVFLIVFTFGVSLLPYAILLPSLSRDVLGLGASEYGILSSANGLGALSGATVVALFSHVGGRTRWWWTGAVLFPLSVVGLSCTRGYYEAMAFLFATGFFMVMSSTSAVSLLQLHSGDAMRGRIMGLFTMSFMGLFPVGSLVGGVLAQVAGVQATLLCMGLFALTVVIAVGFRQGRAL